MIQKQDLQSIISKYYLNGLIEAVKWEIKNNNLTIKFTSPDRSMIGVIVYEGFPLENSSIGVSNTTQLNKLLSITSGPLLLKYAKQKDFIHKLIISDNQFTLTYSLADSIIIPKSGEYVGEESFNIECILDNESIGSIVKAKTALTDVNNVVLKPYINEDNDLLLELMFGGDTEYANKASYFLPNLVTKNLPSNFQQVYDANLIKEIMSCNKDIPSGFIGINLDGVMKLSFDNGKIKSKYYLVSKD